MKISIDVGPSRKNDELPFVYTITSEQAQAALVSIFAAVAVCGDFSRWIEVVNIYPFPRENYPRARRKWEEALARGEQLACGKIVVNAYNELRLEEWFETDMNRPESIRADVEKGIRALAELLQAHYEAGLKEINRTLATIR